MRVHGSMIYWWNLGVVELSRCSSTKGCLLTCMVYIYTMIIIVVYHPTTHATHASEGTVIVSPFASVPIPWKEFFLLPNHKLCWCYLAPKNILLFIIYNLIRTKRDAQYEIRQKMIANKMQPFWLCTWRQNVMERMGIVVIRSIV